MRKLALALSSIALAGTPGCQTPTIDYHRAAAVVSQSSLSTHAVAVDTKQGGNRQLTLDLVPPKDGTFTAQSIVHRWVANDIFQYLVTLSIGNMALVTIPVLVKSGQTQAVFSHLKFGAKYTVTVVAMGNTGGTAASQPLNSQNPATGIVLFSGDNDIEDTKTLTVQVTLDNVMFDGSATVSIGETDGNFTNPNAAEAGAAN